MPRPSTPTSARRPSQIPTSEKEWGSRTWNDSAPRNGGGRYEIRTNFVALLKPLQFRSGHFARLSQPSVKRLWRHIQEAGREMGSALCTKSSTSAPSPGFAAASGASATIPVRAARHLATQEADVRRQHPAVEYQVGYHQHAAPCHRPRGNTTICFVFGWRRITPFNHGSRAPDVGTWLPPDQWQPDKNRTS